MTNAFVDGFFSMNSSMPSINEELLVDKCVSKTDVFLIMSGTRLQQTGLTR